MKWLIRLFFKTLRLIIGPILLISDWITTPKGVERSSEKQQLIDNDARKLVLYQFRTCPFCIKTRRAIKRLSLNIEIRDAQHDDDNRQQLLHGGGQIKVPCLVVNDESQGKTWMYESSDIIDYLQTRFA